MSTRNRILAGLIALFATAASAEAQGWSFGYHKSHGSKSRASFTLSYGNPYRAPVRECRTAPRKVWVPGHHAQVPRRVFVDGGCRREWVPAVYDTRVDSCGRRVTVLVRAGYWHSVPQPGHWETRWVEVWVDGYWKTTY